MAESDEQTDKHIVAECTGCGWKLAESCVQTVVALRESDGIDSDQSEVVEDFSAMHEATCHRGGEVEVKDD